MQHLASSNVTCSADASPPGVHSLRCRNPVSHPRRYPEVNVDNAGLGKRQPRQPSVNAATPLIRVSNIEHAGRVILESPYAADTPEGMQSSIDYARMCLRDSLLRGESPIASQLFYTQPASVYLIVELATDVVRHRINIRSERPVTSPGDIPRTNRSAREVVTESIQLVPFQFSRFQ